MSRILCWRWMGPCKFLAFLQRYLERRLTSSLGYGLGYTGLLEVERLGKVVLKCCI